MDNSAIIEIEGMFGAHHRIDAARSAIGDSGSTQHFIRTLTRKGVRFVGEMREELFHPTQQDAAIQPLPIMGTGCTDDPSSGSQFLQDGRCESGDCNLRRGLPTRQNRHLAHLYQA